MKKVNIVFATFLLAMCGCNQTNTTSDDFITVDVTTKYPLKELILQDFMDVEYIPLETNDEFVCKGLVQDVGEKYIIIRNGNDDGNIYIFGRDGKAIKKINRKGQGAEEYVGVLGVVLDEQQEELFVNDYFVKKIMVYDLDGNFKRSFKHEEDYKYGEVYNFDQNSLICHDVLNENTTKLSLTNVGQSFMIISKQDGSIIKKIQIPFEEKKSIVMKHKDESSGMTYAYMPSTAHPLVPYFDNWIVTELSADTLYNYATDHQMTPFIVRTPSVQSMEPEVFLVTSLLTDRYYFMETIKKENGFPGTNLVYDNKEKKVFRYIVYNNDYDYKEEAFLRSFPVNNKIPSRQYLEPHLLTAEYKRGKLKGRLKEIASTLDEESNPVIMLIKHKK